MRGIFTIDPGESTGMAWGIINTKAKYAYEAVKARIDGGSKTIKGIEQDQIRAIYWEWTRFKRNCVQARLLDPEKVDLVIEDYVLFPGEKPGKATTTPERIAWGFEGYRMARFDNWHISGRHYTPVAWQSPGAAYRFKKRDILRAADAWIVGQEHERSAYAHMLLRTNVLMDKNQ